MFGFETMGEGFDEHGQGRGKDKALPEEEDLQHVIFCRCDFG